MRAKKQLSPENRAFFHLVSRAIFANPFGDERVELDQAISRMSAHSKKEQRIKVAIENIAERFRLLDKEEPIRIADYSREDSQLLEYAFLFYKYYQYAYQFDRLIEEQFSTGEDSVRVPFAKDFLLLLRQRGFRPERALRCFELCYQIRRAFFFIDKGLVGRSPSMKNLRKNLWDNVFTHDIGLYEKYLWNRMEDFSTLLLGETGTGKGTAAAAIGRSGFIPFDIKEDCFKESFMQAFLPINLSQFSETLIESELFGHRKGAFTGACESHKGVFEKCSTHGAILLDEIGEVCEPVQIKLLQVLQDRMFYAVGSHRPRRFQGRVIAATNRSMADIRERGVFRDDFYYRLCSDIIQVPPLRTRIREDARELTDLVNHTLVRMIGDPSSALSDMVLKAIDENLGSQYPWPGNVRELEQCVRSVLIKKQYGGSCKASASPVDTRFQQAFVSGTLDARTLIRGYCGQLYDRLGTYEAVARQTGLDRRTVKKHITQWMSERNSLPA